MPVVWKRFHKKSWTHDQKCSIWGGQASKCLKDSYFLVIKKGIIMDFRITTDFKVKQVSLALPIPFTEKTFRASLQFYKNPNAWSAGIGSQCIDGRHILFFDYDSHDLKQVIGDLQFLQNAFKLSHAYIFQLDRKDSFHAIILDKFSVQKAYSILREANSDPGHRESMKKVRGHEWLLRASKKGERNAPVWRGTLRSDFVNRKISTAHWLFLKEYYEVPMAEYKNEDGFTQIPRIFYNTGNRVDAEIPKEFEEGNAWKERGIK